MAKKLDWEKQNKLKRSKGARENQVKVAGAPEQETFKGDEKPQPTHDLNAPLAKTASIQCPHCGTFIRAARYTRHYNKFHKDILDDSN